MIALLSLILTPMTVSANNTGDFGPVMNAAADTWDRSGGYAMNALDRDEGSLWHSLWNLDAARDYHDPELALPDIEENQENVFPQVWIVEFDNAYRFDRIGYLPRANAFNGTMFLGEWWISTTGSLEDFHTDTGWTKLADFEMSEEEWDETARFVYTDFDEVEAKLVKLKVLDGMGGWASAAYIGFGFTNVPYIPFAGFDHAFEPRTTPMYMQPDLVIRGSKSIIRATDFDSGVNGFEFDAGGANTIRPDETVNTEEGASAFGGNIGWISAGDWVQYTVNVASDGKYKFDAWLASGTDNPGGVKVSVGDTEVGTSPNAVNLGGDTPWQAYDLYEVGVIDLTAGEHVIRVEFPDGGLNFAALEITPYVESVPETEAPTEAPPVENNETDDDETLDENAGNENNETGGTTGNDEEDDGGDMTMIIIIIAVVAVIAIVIIIVVAKKKK